MSRLEGLRILGGESSPVPSPSRAPDEPPPNGEGRPRAVVRALPFHGDDAALVAGLRAGSASAIAALHDRYRAHVARTLSRVLGPDPELPDLLHDVLLAALDSLDKLREPAALKPWLTSIAVFQARTRILRRTRRRWLSFLPWNELPEVEAPPPASGEVTEAVAATYAVLEGLPADERVAFALRFIGGMELSEVAAATSVSLATVKRRLARAEARFVAGAREHAALAEWLSDGSRWGTP